MRWYIILIIIAVLLVAGFFIFLNKPELDMQETSNEENTLPVSIPTTIENNCMGFLTSFPQEVGNIPIAGAGWTRPHPGPFDWGAIEKNKGTHDFSQTDAFLRETQKQGIAILATIWPYAKWDQENRDECKVDSTDLFYPRGSGSSRFGITEYRCKPQDMDSYKIFLSKLIERYDGDGVNDMEELEIPIKYWEIGNEPDLKDSPNLKFFIGSEEDYLELLKESYETIKETCSDCKILHGGASSTQPKTLEFWDKIFSLNGKMYFDVANIHYIEFGDANTLNVAPFKTLLDKYGITSPIWVTEAQFSDPNDDVIGITSGALGAGAEKIFYVGFEVGGVSIPKPGVVDERYKQAVSLCSE